MNHKFLIGCICLIFGSCIANAQNGWMFECWDISQPIPAPKYSDPYGITGVENELIGMTMGVVGSAQWGGAFGPCFAPARTLAAPGRLSFFTGSVGSVQTTFDDNMAMTMGAPFDPVGDFCYVRVTLDNDTSAGVLVDSWYLSFTGASKRYFVQKFAGGGVDVALTARNLGDAIVLAWQITNLQVNPRPIGMNFAAWPALHTDEAEPGSGANAFFCLADNIWSGQSMNFGNPKWTNENYVGYVYTGTTKPLRNPHRLASTSTRFPDFVDFYAGQSTPYGIRFTNLPDASMKKLSPDPLDSRKFIGASSVDLIHIGSYFYTSVNNVIRFNVFGEAADSIKEEADVIDLTQAIVQRYPLQTVAAGASRTIMQVIKGTWGVSDYNDPYTFVVDAPKLINAEPLGQNGVTPNPMTVRAYVDNQYAKLDQEIDMQSVRLVLTLDPNFPGISLAPGETAEKTIPGVRANEIAHVDWQLVSDGVNFGDIPVTVTAFPFPGPSKVIKTKIHVAATPKLRLSEGAQLVTIPYEFPDNSLGSVLGLIPEVDFRAYRWDNGQKAYVQATTAIRGEGYWIVPVSDEGFLTLQNAQIPADRGEGGLLTTIHKGWNIIGNPYNYPVPLSDLVAVVDDAPADTFTWSELVNSGFVASAVAAWKRTEPTLFTGKYVWTQDQSSYLEPHKGYWIFVTTFKDIHISWPGVFLPGMSGSGRAAEDVWKQTERQWRLQIAARNGLSSDTENFIAYTADSSAVKKLMLPKPPTAPDAAIEVVFEGTIDGQLSRVAQAVTDKRTKTEWRTHVNSGAGEVTLTWPNLPSIPKNVRAKVTDVVTGEVRDMRSVSGYTYKMSAAGSREFIVTLEQGGASRPVIGNVIVGGSSRDRSAPMTINYALSADALVTVRVLSGSGKEVFTVTRGRADSAGENQVTWNLRDNANRAVAPGVYRVEILAETPNGERVRKIVPINVVR